LTHQLVLARQSSNTLAQAPSLLELLVIVKCLLLAAAAAVLAIFMAVAAAVAVIFTTHQPFFRQEL
jgi:hypothetical protein